MQNKRGMKILKRMNYIVLAVFAGSAALLGTRLGEMGILPETYLAACGGVCVGFALLLWLARGRRLLNLLCMSAAVLGAAAMLYGLAAVNKADQTVNQVTAWEEQELSQVAVLVLEEDQAEYLSDLHGYQIGYLADFRGQMAEAVMTEILEQRGVVARLVALLSRRRPYVIYTAHGFHFYDGAPMRNWLLYYTAERFLARCTDQLITINQEDYRRAKSFPLKRGERRPGWGARPQKPVSCENL